MTMCMMSSTRSVLPSGAAKLPAWVVAKTNVHRAYNHMWATMHTVQVCAFKTIVSLASYRYIWLLFESKLQQGAVVVAGPPHDDRDDVRLMLYVCY